MIKGVNLYGRRLIVIERFEENGSKIIKTVPVTPLTSESDVHIVAEQVLGYIGKKHNMVIIEQDHEMKPVFDYVANIIDVHKLTRNLNIVEKVYS